VSRVLVWFGKEARSQAPILFAYMFLVLASLAIVCWLLPTAFWANNDGNTGANALAWFVLVGCVGAVAFAAPQLVRGEFAPKDDQFLRRMPGALGTAFAGKALFAVLMAVGLPFVSLLTGELVLTWLGLSYADWFRATHEGEVVLDLPVTASASLASLALLPWVAAIGAWMPGGRMAVGATALFVQVLGAGGVLLMQTCPYLASTLPWKGWLAYAAVVGWGVYGASLRGRRGGGPLRSFGYGFAATSLVLLPPSLWLGNEVWHYRCPSPDRLATISVHGVSTDGKHVLLAGSEDANDNWIKAPFVFDVATRTMRRVGPIGAWITRAQMGPPRPDVYGGPAQWFRIQSLSGRAQLCDLDLGTCTEVATETSGLGMVLSDSQRQAITNQVREIDAVELPDGRRAWTEGEKLFVDGVEVFLAGGLPPTARWRGHGLCDDKRMYDVRTGRVHTLPNTVTKSWSAWCVGEHWLLAGYGRIWCEFDTERGVLDERPELEGAVPVLNLDTKRVLLEQEAQAEADRSHFFAYDPVTREAVEVDLGPSMFPKSRTWLASTQRDGLGRVWLRQFPQGNLWMKSPRFLVLDPATLRCEPASVQPGQLIAFVGDDVFVQEPGMRIVRTNRSTGERTILWEPRAR
jgi:hypothetical protein